MSDDSTQQRDWRGSVFLPRTDFPMKASLPQKEPGILARWQAEDIYRQLRQARAGREKFILHDGPPYANGNMHIGHALNHVLKDMVVRTQSLLGKDAPYVPGWDCHGLPIEWKVEEEYRKKKRNKDDVPPREFRAECRAYAGHWVNTQREQLRRLGVNGDWDHPYLTMAATAEATIVAELLKFAESGQLYRGAKPVMWSPVEKTALAEAEVEYDNITSTQIDVSFEIVACPHAPELVGAHAIIWTTTPWTIPVNQAIAYGADVDYVMVAAAGRRLLLAAPLLDDVWKRIHTGAGADAAPAPLWRGRGTALAGARARHPMADTLPDSPFFTAWRPFLAGDFVTTDSGTGIVHMAPDHGEDDFLLCKAWAEDLGTPDLPLAPVFAVQADGRYRADWPWMGGEGSVIHPRLNAPEGPICTALRDAGGLCAASADYVHSYPHSWRSKAKLIYRCTPQWFVPMDRPIRHDGDAGDASGDGPSLRDTALAAIASTRFVPEKGRNRIGAMVAGRPDWVLSRQRAWGVPITLFVHRQTGRYLVDRQVNTRIIDAIRIDGVDAWDAARAQEFLGSAYRAEDYEQITDILDVWFDSGSTHAFVLESGTWPDLVRPAGYRGPLADLYLEGSDQHRGWFQSSLLEACATRGHAPYKAVLTHGFTMDARGLKMSKSLDNTVDPLKLMENYGADIIRLWALSVDYTEDHRIGDEILKGTADQYRKLRNSFRYLLGALDGFDDAEKLPVADMPELERAMLALLARLSTVLRQAVEDFDYNSYVRTLIDFCNEDLSAFFFDIRKDCLYCDAPDSARRRAYRTVLDIMFHALVRWAAPVLVFTAEEVWHTRFPDAGSVHLLEWPEIPTTCIDTERWAALRTLRAQVLGAIEVLRRDKVLGSSLEAEVTIPANAPEADLAELFITADVRRDERGGDDGSGGIHVIRTAHHKCGRCWRHLPEVTEDGALCTRCARAVGASGPAAGGAAA